MKYVVHLYSLFGVCISCPVANEYEPTLSPIASSKKVCSVIRIASETSRPKNVHGKRFLMVIRNISTSLGFSYPRRPNEIRCVDRRPRRGHV